MFAINFRPRVGMGWFLCKNGSITLPKQIFVPAWGWVGSLCLLLKCANLRGIRPRLGMGWFLKLKLKVFISGSQIFVPAWGRVGSQLQLSKLRRYLRIFVPAWGWVGSNELVWSLLFTKIFVPAWGWGGSRMIKSRHTAISKFSSPLGDGLVLRKKTMILTCSMIFRPRLGMGWFENLFE